MSKENVGDLIAEPGGKDFDGTLSAALEIVEGELDENPRTSGKQVLALLKELHETAAPPASQDVPQAAAKAKDEKSDGAEARETMIATLEAAADKMDERPLISTTRGWLARWLRKEAEVLRAE